MNTRMIAVLSLAAAGFAFAETPDKFVRYVESTGSQYVDTGVTGRWNTKVEAQVEWMDFADSALVGSRTSGSTGSRLYFCYCLNGDGNMYTTTSGGGEKVVWNGNWEARWEKNRIYDFSSEFSATNAAGETTNIIKADPPTPQARRPTSSRRTASPCGARRPPPSTPATPSTSSRAMSAGPQATSPRLAFTG